MKICSLFALVLATAPLHGQSTTPSASPNPTPTASTEKAPIDVLTAAEKQHLEDAHQKALDAYPQLLQEEQHIQGEIAAMHNGAAITKEEIMRQFVAHREQLEIYMVKVDPSVQPLLQRIHAAQAKMKSTASAPAPPQ